MLTTLILVVHVIVCISLIFIILLQSGKGADIGAVFGGGSSQTLFGSSGAGTFLSKITIAAAVIFMVTSIFLTYFSGKNAPLQDKSLMSGSSVPVPAMPAPAPFGGSDTPGESGAKPESAPAAAPMPAAPDKPADAAPAAAPSAPAPPAEKPAESR